MVITIRFLKVLYLGDTCVDMSTSVGRFSFLFLFCENHRFWFLGQVLRIAPVFFLIFILRTALIFRISFEKSNQAVFKVSDFHKILSLDLGGQFSQVDSHKSRFLIYICIYFTFYFIFLCFFSYNQHF
jgi:hypothetical protein